MSFSNHFSIRNVPYGIATSSSHAQKAVVTRVHDHVFFLSDLPIQTSEEVRQAFAQVRSDKTEAEKSQCLELKG